MDILDIGHSVKQLRKKFAQSTGLPLREALSAATIATALRAEGVSYRCCLLDPVVTVWAFLSQILDTDRTCRKALGRIWAYLSASDPDAVPIPAPTAKPVSACPKGWSTDCMARWLISWKTGSKRRVCGGDGMCIWLMAPLYCCPIHRPIKRPIRNMLTSRKAVVSP